MDPSLNSNNNLGKEGNYIMNNLEQCSILNMFNKSIHNLNNIYTYFIRSGGIGAVLLYYRTNEFKQHNLSIYYYDWQFLHSLQTRCTELRHWGSCRGRWWWSALTHINMAMTIFAFVFRLWRRFSKYVWLFINTTTFRFPLVHMLIIHRFFSPNDLLLVFRFTQYQSNSTWTFLRFWPSSSFESCLRSCHNWSFCPSHSVCFNVLGPNLNYRLVVSVWNVVITF